jgi:extracellular factor (EF) 3-hydroxypalmitic acid methyl ester biosynthesis protein
MTATFPLVETPTDLHSRALHALHGLNDEFVGLCSRELSDVERYHSVVALTHALCAAIVTCENAGHSRDQIVAVLDDVRRLHAESPFVKRLQSWPRGYAGDFETVDYICGADNRCTPDTFAHTLEAYSLSRSIAQQHRNKVQEQANRILDCMIQKPRASRILSLASGSCADLQLLRRVLPHVVGELYLNDADADALGFSREALGEVAAACRFLPGNALRVVKRLQKEEGFDLVIAGGLFDYLPENQSVYLMRNVYDGLLSPGGRLFFTNIAAGNPYRPLIEYFGDWFLIERSEADILRYCALAGIPAENVRITRDVTKLALLVDVLKE